MTFRHLEIFMSVYQNQSITKASKELHISQPSVSLANETEGWLMCNSLDALVIL